MLQTTPPQPRLRSPLLTKEGSLVPKRLLQEAKCASGRTHPILPGYFRNLSPGFWIYRNPFSDASHFFNRFRLTGNQDPVGTWSQRAALDVFDQLLDVRVEGIIA